VLLTRGIRGLVVQARSNVGDRWVWREVKKKRKKQKRKSVGRAEIFIFFCDQLSTDPALPCQPVNLMCLSVSLSRCGTLTTHALSNWVRIIVGQGRRKRKSGKKTLLHLSALFIVIEYSNSIEIQKTVSQVQSCAVHAIYFRFDFCSCTLSTLCSLAKRWTRVIHTFSLLNNDLDSPLGKQTQTCISINTSLASSFIRAIRAKLTLSFCHFQLHSSAFYSVHPSFRNF
jgi:hypothetical protein